MRRARLKLTTAFGDTKERRAKINSACSGLRMVLIAARDTVASVGVPGLAVAMSGLLLVVDVIQKTGQTVEDVVKLTTHIEKLARVLSEALERGTISHLAANRIDRLASTLKRVSDDAEKLGSKGFIARALTSDQDGQRLQAQIQALSWSIESFTLETVMNMEFLLDDHIRFVQDSTRATQNIVTATHLAVQEWSYKMEAKEGYLPRAAQASFNSKERECCSDSTRESILRDIFDWVHCDCPDDTSATNVPHSQIFWLNGSAGTGKTTIAYTVAKHCWNAMPRVLGASFFCSRDDDDCSKLRLIFPTISHQLGIFNPAFGVAVSGIIKANPEIVYAGVQYQLDELIVKPLALVRNTFNRCIVILDALDECRDTGTISAVLAALSHHVVDLLPLKFFITSRPETQITMGFADPILRDKTARFVLHQVELPVVQADIHTYLSSRLARTRTLYGISESWPSPECLRALTRLSSGLFIFASTSTKFIEDPFYSNPREQLALLLRNAGRVVGRSSPSDCLDQLYTQILTLAYPELSSKQLRVLKTVLGSILHLRDPLSPVALDNLLGLNPGRVKETLLRLHSLVIMPDNDDQSIRLLHPSFFDFLTEPTRCSIPHLTMKWEEQNTLIALSCMRVMLQLTRDMCRLGQPTLLNIEIPDLSVRIAAHIPPHLKYACLHWAFHLSNGLLTDMVLGALDQFCAEHLLHWIEVCSLLGELRSALHSVGDLCQKFWVRCRVSSDTITLLNDAQHLIREFFPIISTTALQVYHSALLFLPDHALLLKRYQQEMNLAIQTYNAVDGRWSPCEMVIDGQSAGFQSVCLSPDGSYILSGSEGHVDLWDAMTGALLQTFGGLSLSITSVAFSWDGTRIAAGSEDAHVLMWDARTGGHLWTFEGHSQSVESVSFHPGKQWIIASGSRDNTIRVWDAQLCIHIRTLRGHSGPVLSVTFSADGASLVSGSADQTLRLWDAIKLIPVRTFRRYPEFVMSVAISSDGKRIAAGCSDQMVWICDASNGDNMKALKGHSGRVTSVAFSPDAKQVASGSMDHTIRLWDVETGAQLLTLEKHAEWVTSVAFSADGTRIVSGSEDRTIRMWDISSSARLRSFTVHASRVAFSADGATLALLSTDNKIMILDVSSGTCLRTLHGHRDGLITHLAFDPNGRHFVAAAQNNIKIWGRDSIEASHKLRGHAGWVLVVAFSSTGAHMASGSDDKSVMLWDIEAGTHLRTLMCHSEAVTYLAFSRDGTRIVSGANDNIIALWSCPNGQLLEKIHHNEESHLSVESAMSTSVFLMDGGWLCFCEGSTKNMLDPCRFKTH
ncbi:WD40 repeat-like protein [Mycena venus]|uniref:WD40 repeat-like protein n=1 Tax=Mycena venus TaxID=2733690 RepID=A0A8H6XFD9_9AGAR|nr:WD40 repeat-like protein [Mycena venus]